MEYKTFTLFIKITGIRYIKYDKVFYFDELCVGDRDYMSNTIIKKDNKWDRYISILILDYLYLILKL